MSWDDCIAGASDHLSRRLLSRDELDRVIREVLTDETSPVNAAVFGIEPSAPFDRVSFGASGDGDTHDRSSVTLANGVRLQTELWYREGVEDQERTRAKEAFRDLVTRWWRGDGFGEKAKILSTQLSQIQEAVEMTVHEWSARGPVAFVFFDIDHFKLVNDLLSQAEGDRMITKLAAAFTRRTPSDAIAVHRDGDEFFVLMSADDPADVVARAMSLRGAVESDLLAGEPQLPGETQLGVSAGISFVEGAFDYEDLATRAEKALKPGGSKRRGRVSLEEIEESPSLPYSDLVALSIALTLSRLGDRMPFANPWLAHLSTRAEMLIREAGDLDGLAESLRAVIDEISPDLDVTARESARQRPESSFSGALRLSPFDIVLAVTHGIARGALRTADTARRWTFGYRADGSSARLYAEGEATVVLTLGQHEPDREVAVPWSDHAVEEVPDTHVALLVAIGDGTLGLPEELFADVVVVDDRPSLGGGLPDQWEAALARVVSDVSRYPNVRCVVALGDTNSGAQTLTRLHGASGWAESDTLDALAYKLGLQTGLIIEAATKIGDRVSHVTSAGEALDCVLAVLGTAAVEATRADEAQPAPRLVRPIAMEKLLLGADAGCRVGTAYEAYPIALNIVRQPDGRRARDQADREFIELIDFRIHLTHPTTDQIPRYHRDEEAELERYFRTEFCEPNGIFRRPLEENGQLERVLDHVAQTIKRRGYTSRRAILVVPHIPEGDELSPLGLVSVRIIPRASEGGSATVLDYSFAWRTVEALVGLPYSLYGSIQFGLHLTGLVAERLEPSERAGLRMGQLSYIAHSLHLFLDEYAQNIARRIVNDDTI